MFPASDSRSLEERCDDFWEWFQDNSSRLLGMAPRELAESGLIGARLRSVTNGLVYEIDISRPPLRELVISADGAVDRFPSVKMLIARAPEIDGWSFIAFRQRAAEFASGSILIAGKTISGKDLTYSLRASNNRIHVELFIPGCPTRPDAAFIGIGFLFLDGAIGEYDAATKLGQLEIMAPERRGRGLKRGPFAQFRADFDTLFQKVCVT